MAPSDSSRLLGRRLSAALALRGLTLEDLAKASDTTRQTAWRYANGLSSQNFWIIAKMAKHLGVRMEWLAYGEEPMQSSSNQNGGGT
jgi:transcriptional regulator with XRE-family HTH domain